MKQDLRLRIVARIQIDLTKVVEDFECPWLQAVSFFEFDLGRFILFLARKQQAKSEMLLHVIFALN